VLCAGWTVWSAVPIRPRLAYLKSDDIAPHRVPDLGRLDLVISNNVPGKTLTVRVMGIDTAKEGSDKNGDR